MSEARTSDAPWLRPLETERLVIVAATLDHTDAFVDALLDSSAEVARWSRKSAAFDRETLTSQANGRVATTAAGTFVQRLAFTRATGAFAAGVGIFPWLDPRTTTDATARTHAEPSDSKPVRVDVAGELELGTWCRTSLAGQGFASEACGAVVKHAFRDLGARRLWVRVSESNAPSLHVATRLGFIEEARVPFPASDEWGPANTVVFLRRDA